MRHLVQQAFRAPVSMIGKPIDGSFIRRLLGSNQLKPNSSDKL